MSRERETNDKWRPREREIIVKWRPREREILLSNEDQEREREKTSTHSFSRSHLYKSEIHDFIIIQMR
jgi:hypothetical protein